MTLTDEEIIRLAKEHGMTVHPPLRLEALDANFLHLVEPKELTRFGEKLLAFARSIEKSAAPAAVAEVRRRNDFEETLFARWLVWSHEHQGYWPQNRMGYVPTLAEAGCFTFAEAVEIVWQANYGMRGRFPEETMMPVPNLVRL